MLKMLCHQLRPMAFKARRSGQTGWYTIVTCLGATATLVSTSALAAPSRGLPQKKSTREIATQCEMYQKNPASQPALKAVFQLKGVSRCDQLAGLLMNPGGTAVQEPASLGGLGITDLRPLSLLSFRSSLDLSNNQISSLSGLGSSIQNSPLINLSQNRISSIDGLSPILEREQAPEAVDRPVILLDHNQINQPSAIARLAAKAIVSLAHNESGRGNRYDECLNAGSNLYAALRTKNPATVASHLSSSATRVLDSSGGSPQEIAATLMSRFADAETMVLSVLPGTLFYTHTERGNSFSVEADEYFAFSPVPSAVKRDGAALTGWSFRSLILKGELDSQGLIISLTAETRRPLSIRKPHAAPNLNALVQRIHMLWGQADLAPILTPTQLQLEQHGHEAMATGRFVRSQELNPDIPWGRSIVLAEIEGPAGRKEWVVTRQNDWYGILPLCPCGSHKECETKAGNCGYDRSVHLAQVR